MSDCSCERCQGDRARKSWADGFFNKIQYLPLCPECGSKGCSKARDHRADCTHGCAHLSTYDSEISTQIVRCSDCYATLRKADFIKAVKMPGDINRRLK